MNRTNVWYNDIEFSSIMIQSRFSRDLLSKKWFNSRKIKNANSAWNGKGLQNLVNADSQIKWETYPGSSLTQLSFN